jgi:hypothetical protein
MILAIAALVLGAAGAGLAVYAAFFKSDDESSSTATTVTTPAAGAGLTPRTIVLTNDSFDADGRYTVPADLADKHVMMVVNVSSAADRFLRLPALATNNDGATYSIVYGFASGGKVTLETTGENVLGNGTVFSVSGLGGAATLQGHLATARWYFV